MPDRQQLMPLETSKARAWFTIDLGAMIRGQVRRDIEGEAWRRGLEIHTDESKGFFESVYRFTVTGRSDAVQRFITDVERWARETFDA